MANYLTPEQVRDYTVETGIVKAGRGFTQNFMLAFMGGMFIALATIGSIVASCTIQNFGIASLTAGAVFSTGLMMVVIAGGDLFTGNVLMIAAVLQRKISAARMAANLAAAFAGNLAGALFIAIMVNYSGLLHNANGMIIQKLADKAVHKLELPFLQAFILGILCNLLVCLAVWMMYAAKDIAGKAAACLFPISLFILSGYEHIVANMYYIPAGLLAGRDAKLASLAGASGEVLSQLEWWSAVNNFVPVTLGNLAGGLIIGIAYSVIFRRI